VIPARFRLHPAAVAEIEAALDWYCSVSDVAGGQFLDELDHVFRRIATSPS